MNAPSVPPIATRLWRELAGDEEALRPRTRTVVRGSRGLCPSGWTGVLRLGDAVVVEAGDAPREAVEQLLGLDDPTNAEAVHSVLGPTDTLGPGILHYSPSPRAVADLVAGHTTEVLAVASLSSWLDALDPDDVEESGVGDLDEAVVLRDGGDVVAAAGHHVWPRDVAHLGVLVSPAARGTGLGTAVAAAAVRRAAAAGLAPQWRAHADNAASRRIARRLGMREVGAQLSLDLRGSRARV